MEAPVLAQAGLQVYEDFAPQFAVSQRAGDLSGINVDLTNGSFWAINEFADDELLPTFDNPSADWGTNITNFSLATTTAIGTTTAVGTSPTSSVFGQSVTLMASVTPNSSGTPTGTVTFEQGSTILGTGTLSNGSTSISSTALTVGTDTITATYNGDSNFAASSGSTTETVSQAATTTALAAAPAASVFGQAVTFTATVTVNAPGSGTPKGTVTFKDGSTTVATVSLSGGSASLMTTSLSVGSHTITASYNGGVNFATSSGSTTETVSQDATTTAVSAAPGTSVFGQPVTFTAIVTANAPGSGTPKGTVTFRDGSTILASVALSGGAASFSTTLLSVRTHTLTTTYNGGVNFASSSGTTTETVTQAATTTALSATLASSVFGQPVTFTAIVTANAPGSGTPQGTVTFRDGSTILASVALGNGAASYSTAALSVGSHTISATYNGGVNYAASSSSTTETVSQDATSTALGVSPSTSVFGQPVIFTATVKSLAPGSGTPMGTVTFREGSTILATASLSGGSASYTTAMLGAGSHTITATYNGGVNYMASSGSAGETVSKDTTTTALSATPTSSTFGQPVTFTAIVSANAPGSGTPTGTVTFTDGSTLLATVALSGSSASFSTASLSGGSHTITATYSGDSNFTTSSGTATVTVGMAATTTLSASLASSAAGRAEAFPATISAIAQGTGNIPGWGGSFATLTAGAATASPSRSWSAETLQTTNLATTAFVAQIIQETGEGWGTILGHQPARKPLPSASWPGEERDQE
jgi:hypothetical protein